MANTMKALQTTTVGAGGAASIVFSSIPATYTDLVIKYSLRSTSAAARMNINVTFNAISSDYRSNYLSGASGTVGSATNATGTSTMYVGEIPAATATASTFASGEIYVPSYFSANTKGLLTSNVQEGSTTSDIFTSIIAGSNSSSATISAITITPGAGNFVQYSTATLYGVFNADVSSVPSTPTIGTASDAATSGEATVAFTPVTGAASYTVTSSPGSITATRITTPITVSGLTNGTAYTFTCVANNPIGASAASAASNSVTPTAQYNSIATVSYSTGTGGDVTFSNIPTNYRNLQIRMFMRDTRAASDSTWFMQFNGDTGNNYSYQGMSSNGGSISAVTSTTTNSMQGITSASSTGASRFGSAVIDIYDANQTNKYKTTTYQSGFTNNGSGNLYTIAGTWRSTAGITSITIKPNTGFAQYSHFALYGIG